MKWGLTKRNSSMDSEVDLFHKRVSSLFDDFFNIESSNFFKNEWNPVVDVHEDTKSIQIKAEVPGIDEKDIKVELQNNILTISGEKKEERHEEQKGKEWVISECSYGSFSRSIALPEGIKPEEVKAEYKRGVLSITIPRDHQIADAKRIKIDVK